MRTKRRVCSRCKPTLTCGCGALCAPCSPRQVPEMLGAGASRCAHLLSNLVSHCHDLVVQQTTGRLQILWYQATNRGYRFLTTARLVGHSLGIADDPRPTGKKHSRFFQEPRSVHPLSCPRKHSATTLGRSRHRAAAKSAYGLANKHPARRTQRHHARL